MKSLLLDTKEILTWLRRVSLICTILDFCEHEQTKKIVPECAFNMSRSKCTNLFSTKIWKWNILFFMKTSILYYYCFFFIAEYEFGIPLFTVGIGYASCFMAYLVAFYYNVVIGWAFYYLFSSFTSDLPWKTCDHEWNSPNCWKLQGGQFNASGINDTDQNVNHSVSSSYEFFEWVIVLYRTEQNRTFILIKSYTRLWYTSGMVYISL